VVIDHLPVLTEDPDLLITDLDYDIGDFKFKETDSVVVLTKGERDVPTLLALSRSKVGFVGILASLQRVAQDVEELRALRVSPGFIESLHSPVGVEIGAITPQEVVISVMADVIAARRGKHTAHTAFLSKVMGAMRSAGQPRKD